MDEIARKLRDTSEEVLQVIEKATYFEQVKRPSHRLRLTDGRLAEVRVEITTDEEDFFDMEEWVMEFEAVVDKIGRMSVPKHVKKELGINGKEAHCSITIEVIEVYEEE